MINLDELLERITGVLSEEPEHKSLALETFIMDELPPLIEELKRTRHEKNFLELELAEARKELEE